MYQPSRDKRSIYSPPTSYHTRGVSRPSMAKVSEGMGVTIDWLSFEKILPGGWEVYLEKHYAEQGMDVPEYLHERILE